MLADRVKSEEEAVKRIGDEFAAEYKLDGERVQIHIQNNKVILFSRSLENITYYYPDIVEKISDIVNANDGIFEAEIVAINKNTGNFLPFQELMHRRRKHKLDQAITDYPITVNFFDILYHNGNELLNYPYNERRKNLEKPLRRMNLQNSFQCLL